ncbi:MAG TPA: hypothetical protein PK987_13615 [Ferruginibacter sp.]|nr:hypothetical protein [Ferruginibacter sp.]
MRREAILSFFILSILLNKPHYKKGNLHSLLKGNILIIQLIDLKNTVKYMLPIWHENYLAYCL